MGGFRVLVMETVPVMGFQHRTAGATDMVPCKRELEYLKRVRVAWLNGRQQPPFNLWQSEKTSGGKYF